MDALTLRKQAAWLDGCAIRFKELEVAGLMRRYADEARARAAIAEGRGPRDAARPALFG